jgi:Secretion system C-terminal sorting domain
MKLPQLINTAKFVLSITFMMMTLTVSVGQSHLPCPPPVLINYTLFITPTNTISAGTTVVFKVMDASNGNFINDACFKGDWFVNDSIVFSRPLGDGSTTTSYGYSTNLLLNNDVVTCNVYPICDCVPFSMSAIGNPITMHVSGILPIELLNFSGNTEGGINRLFWTTATEINNKGFQVERLNSTAKIWDILGFVSAQGKAASYEFTDKHPLSTNYYRLRQIDTDGKEQLSKVINLLTINQKQLVVYPNPTAQILNVDFGSSAEKQNLTFQIFNILGQQVQTGTLTNSIDVSALTLGTYFLKVGTEQIKFHKL